MKKHFIKSFHVAAFLSICSLGAIAQKANVGIGTTRPDESAVLDISSSNKGLLMPRMTLQQRSNIQNPANGLIVYQTDMLSGFYFYDGKDWKSLTEAKSIAGTDGDWTLIGNAGTNPATNFIGTTDNQPLMFRVNNVSAGMINAAKSNVTFGTEAGSLSMTGANNVGMGTRALMNNTSGSENLAFGYAALQSNTSGLKNIAVGSSGLYSITTGQENVGIGFAAGYFSTGSYNTIVGNGAAFKSTGNNNVGVGYQAGFNNALGSSSIFIGYQAGYDETSSNKLYIANSNTTTPLVYGDFATKYLAVGEVAAADRAAATSGGYRLLVKGGMITEKIKVAVAGSADWADYVFEPSYKLMSLDKVESFVKDNKHLPNVPSAEEMSKNGLDVMQTSAKLMEKIEELTLYMIEMNKEIQALKAENAKLKK